MKSPERFSAEAAVLWSSIPTQGRERILKAVWCSNCRGAVTIVDFNGEARKGDLILTGKCAKCGGEVVRRLETSELNGVRN
jgi:hypothetical protein